MHFDLTPEQQALHDRIATGVRELTRGDMVLRDRDGVFDHDGWPRLAALGLCGLTVPEALGGAGLDPLGAVIALEAFGYASDDNGMGLAIGAHLFGCLSTLLHADAARFADPIRALATGERIGALAVTERDAGSDLAPLATTAERVAGGYRLNGCKSFVTNGPVADVFVVLAATGNTRSPFRFSAFLVERGTAGLSTPDPVAKMGMRTALMGDVLLNDCVVPERARIGAEGAGLTIFQRAMEWERAFILAPAVGAMRRVYDASLAYARTRRQFDQPIAQFEPVHRRLVAIHCRIEACRLLLQRTAARKAAGRSVALDGAATKMVIAEAWVATCQDALSIHAGYGYLAESGVERELRDAHAAQIYSGTADIQVKTIARLLKIIA